MPDPSENSWSVSRRRLLRGAGVTAAAAALAHGTSAAVGTEPAGRRAEVAAFYFPNWHLDPLNEYWFGRGWSEWELLKVAGPRFRGHDQPKRPVWGMQDEADPAVMARKIDAAADHGLDAFMFDWYWYTTAENRFEPYLHRALEQGFMKAPNAQRLKFALMWANHDWNNLFPVHRSNPVNTHQVGDGPPMRGVQSPASFDRLVDYVCDTYLAHPSYWRVDGGAYFSIYEVDKFVAGYGGDLTAARKALDRFRERAQAAGAGELHLNCMTVGCSHGSPASIATRNRLVEQLGMDSHTTYVWIHHGGFTEFPGTPYPVMRDFAADVWTAFGDGFEKPYFPNVTMGWDSSPRCVSSDMWENIGYPYTPIISGNSPKEFERALTLARDHALASDGPPVVTVNAWNEWTEGSYLEPDKTHGYGHLQALLKVFGRKGGA